VGRVYKHHYALAQKFLELTEKHPNDPVALDRLIQAVWQVNTRRLRWLTGAQIRIAAQVSPQGL
jgi:hypothetical protein